MKIQLKSEWVFYYSWILFPTIMVDTNQEIENGKIINSFGAGFLWLKYKLQIKFSFVKKIKI
jgi:hypothetical protein